MTGYLEEILNKPENLEAIGRMIFHSEKARRWRRLRKIFHGMGKTIRRFLERSGL